MVNLLFIQKQWLWCGMAMLTYSSFKKHFVYSTNIEWDRMFSYYFYILVRALAFCMTLFEVETMTAVEHNAKPQEHKISMFIRVCCL